MEEENLRKLASIAIFVDIQGFSRIYQVDQDKALRNLHQLMQVLDRLRKVRRKNRIDIHQVGDGFLLVNEGFSLGSEYKIEEELAVSLTILRCSVINGFNVKVAISFGELADVQGCYPRGTKEGGHEMGIFTLFTVMGTALIKSYEFSKKASGPLLIIDKTLEQHIPEWDMHIDNYAKHLEINWITVKNKRVDELCLLASDELQYLISKLKNEPNLFQKILIDYINQDKDIPDIWLRGARSLFA